MANKKAALKALRKSKKLQISNSQAKSNIKELVKKSRKAIETKSDDVQTLIKNTAKAIDKAVQKGILKENTSRRKKSRLMKKFNVAFSKK